GGRAGRSPPSGAPRSRRRWRPWRGACRRAPTARPRCCAAASAQRSSSIPRVLPENRERSLGTPLPSSTTDLNSERKFRLTPRSGQLDLSTLLWITCADAGHDVWEAWGRPCGKRRPPPPEALLSWESSVHV